MDDRGTLGRRGFTALAAGVVAALGTTGAALPGGPGHGGGRPPRGRGMRGVWVASITNRDWPSAPGLPAEVQKNELLGHLDTAVERRLDTVILQVRPSADALWPSPYEPWSAFLTGEQGKDPGYDPLGFAVREAHKRGLELHAWFNPYRVAVHDDPARLVPTHPARINPDWVVTYQGQLYYNPGLPEVRRYVEDAMLDAVARYDIDAVHWDDYFYPYPVAGAPFDDDRAFALYGGGFPDRAAWRRHNTDQLVRETRARLRRLEPRVRFGISPFGVWRNASTDPRGSATTAGVQSYDDLYADTLRWVREGWIDHIVPQLYWNIGFRAADYATLARWWAGAVRGTGVDLYLGEALYKAGDPAQPAAWQDPAELSRHLDLTARIPEVRGHAYFAAKEVAADPLGAMSRVVRDHYGERAPRRG
ncbi:glycoside hydrolase family 10 protein [Streptomyces sp. SPB074]|uniref:glycoside hydrolase family 10 protein n=1 Tax=Streptomyces sp. (strain SPB074) TaxID=465543 RepID=UPI00017F22A6|nr:family 10 glycosylhydrolase [Streptomyces sp. SPB074]EDY45623.1 YngK protein [Streptomyces sp. SPB074]